MVEGRLLGVRFRGGVARCHLLLHEDDLFMGAGCAIHAAPVDVALVEAEAERGGRDRDGNRRHHQVARCGAEEVEH